MGIMKQWDEKNKTQDWHLLCSFQLETTAIGIGTFFFVEM